MWEVLCRQKIRSSSIFTKKLSSTTCSRNPYSLSTSDLHTARPPNKFRPQHKTQNDRRTKHPEFRNSGRVFETLHIWNVLVNDNSGSLGTYWTILTHCNISAKVHILTILAELTLSIHLRETSCTSWESKSYFEESIFWMKIDNVDLTMDRALVC